MFFLDEVQLLQEFEEVLNSLLHIDNADVYVTGSNYPFSVKRCDYSSLEVRGEEIHITPIVVC